MNCSMGTHFSIVPKAKALLLRHLEKTGKISAFLLKLRNTFFQIKFIQKKIKFVQKTMKVRTDVLRY